MTTVPFRWDLVAPAQLGTMLDGMEPPWLGFVPQLAECAGRVVARSGHGDLAFVGRSLDTMYDLLCGAFRGIDTAPQLSRLPLSFDRGRGPGDRETTFARSLLAELGMTPHAIARRRRPVTFVDVVWRGSTFTRVFDLLRAWVDAEHAQWDVVRTKIRFVGVTSRTVTSPKVERWAQQQDWTRQLPGRSVTSVSLDAQLWSYLGDQQDKLTSSFTPTRWLADPDGPDRSDRTRRALAEAVAVVELGRDPAVRRIIAASMAGEPALSESWLRALRGRLNA